MSFYHFRAKAARNQKKYATSASVISSRREEEVRARNEERAGL